MDQLPARFEPAELARSCRAASKTLPVSHFSRFAAMLADDSGDVVIEAKFGWTDGEARLPEAKGRQTSQIKMICQRCQKPVSRQLSSKFELVFVKAEAEAEALPENMDPVLLGESEDISIVDFLEDELILQLPTRVVHEDETDCDPAVIAALSGVAKTPTKTHNPFKGLDKLLKE